MSRVSSEFVAVIPAYNEAFTIREVAARTLEYVSRVIIVDDGSSDHTATVCQDLPVVVLRHRHNRGKAAALWHGMQQAMEQHATAIITLDGDGQHDANDIPALIAMHRRDPLAVVIGSRLHDPRRIPPKRYAANRMANFWISWAAGQPIGDSQSGFRIYPSSVLRTAGIRCDHETGFVFESEILIEAGRLGTPIRSVPISVEYGRHLRDSHFRQGRDIGQITRMVAGKLLSRRMDVSGLVRSFKAPHAMPPRRACPQVAKGNDRRAIRRRILFIAESVTLAHIARTVALARTLNPRRYDVHLACDRRYLSVFGRLPFPVHSIHSISSAQFHRRLIEADPLYTEEELRGYVKEDLRLLARLGPDVVVGDFRLSLSASARVVGIPYLSIANAYWSPYARPRFVVPDVEIVDRFGVRLGQGLFNLLRPIVFAHHATALNRIRRDYGLPAIRYDLSSSFTDGDKTLYADLPELVPTFKRPSHHHYLGPILWSYDSAPDWWDDVPKDRPLAYVSLGSSGKGELLPGVLTMLARLGVNAMVSTAGHPTPASVPGQVWVGEYLPGLEAARRANIVICNGGSATVYQALAAGVPVIGLPYNLDQYLMMDYVQEFGVGEYVRSGQASIDAMERAATTILSDVSYERKAQSLKESVQAHRCDKRFLQIVESLFGSQADEIKTRHRTLERLETVPH